MHSENGFCVRCVWTWHRQQQQDCNFHCQGKAEDGLLTALLAALPSAAPSLQVSQPSTLRQQLTVLPVSASAHLPPAGVQQVGSFSASCLTEPASSAVQLPVEPYFWDLHHFRSVWVPNQCRTAQQG